MKLPAHQFLNEEQLKALRQMPEGAALKTLLHQFNLKRSQASKLLSAIRRKY